MLFGDEAQILSVIYGPAKSAMWKTLRQSPQQLAQQNGLWEAILNLSDAVLADSTTLDDSPLPLVLKREHRRVKEPIRFPTATPTGVFSEHDVDSTLHILFARQSDHGVFEGMCNPPGGDWSGLSLLDFQTGTEYRWTSLPRVSGAGGKRPDHMIQFSREGKRSILLAIESKTQSTDLEENVGSRLKVYIRRLIGTDPIAIRPAKREWKLWAGGAADLPSDFSLVSGGAFCWRNARDMENALTRGKLDIVFAVEFKSGEQPTLLHIRARADAAALLPNIHELARQLGGRIEIQVH
jgi:hypothetical protein